MKTNKILNQLDDAAELIYIAKEYIEEERLDDAECSIDDIFDVLTKVKEELEENPIEDE